MHKRLLDDIKKEVQAKHHNNIQIGSQQQHKVITNTEVRGKCNQINNKFNHKKKVLKFKIRSVNHLHTHRGQAFTEILDPGWVESAKFLLTQSSQPRSRNRHERFRLE